MKIAVLGAGKMALALVHGILRSELCTGDRIVVASRSTENLQNFASATGVKTAATNSKAVASADLVLLCVKPSDAVAALKSAAAGLKGRLLVSVAAGLSSKTLLAAAPGARIIRAMPNTAAMVGRSATAVAPSASATRDDIDLATRIFLSVGKVVQATESQLDAITGLSGSGPAYLYLVVEALTDGAVAAGLPRATARELAIATLAGAAEMLSSTSEHPAVLREMVTSPGGTTIAGLMVLEKAGVRSALAEAVKAAATRSRELSGDNP
ncbi:MAG: pyrroline-5-carboxylate reductase [Terrimicrobiaceae bacterium]